MGITSSEYHKRFCARIEWKRRREAQKRANRVRLSKTKRHKRKKAGYHNQLKSLRNAVRRDMFSKYSFTNAPIDVSIVGEVGLEVPDSVASFLSLGSQCIDSNSSHIRLDLSKCTRLWPSALTMLCSLKQWTELACSVIHRKEYPRISSSSPENMEIETYLIHSGFYKYVGRDHIRKEHNYSDAEIVKIKREKDRSQMEDREREITDLVKKYSTFSEEEIELFQCKILPEILNNVIEHGVTVHDQGWWLLGQYHKTHKFISISIADNGIGFRLNLITGPQGSEIKDRLGSDPENDCDFIELAFEEKVSGAHNASTKDEGIIKKRYYRGASRGNGLKHIRKTCKECGIRLAVFSHNGYIMFNSNGEIELKGSSKERVFAGTLYHLTIPAI